MLVRALFVLAPLAPSVYGTASLAQGGGAVAVNRDAAIQAEFQDRIAEYMQLQKQLKAKLPTLSNDATPQQLDQHKRTLEKLITAARSSAKPGHLFMPEMQALIRARFAKLFTGERGRRAKKQIHDEPHPITPEVNKRYPAAVPLATMPASVLEALPKLPDELEYRFLGNHLIILDVDAELIVDYVLNAIPQ